MLVRYYRNAAAIIMVMILSACSVAPTSLSVSAIDKPEPIALEEEKTQVQYAGFVFLGDAVDLPTRYPHSFAISEQLNAGGNTSLDRLLLNELVDNPPNYLDISTANTDSRDSGLAFAVAISDEQTEIDQIDGGQYKLRTTLMAQILIIDFSNFSVVAAYPLEPIFYQDNSFAKRPTSQQISAFFETLLLDKTLANPFMATVSNRIKTLEPKLKTGNNIQVTNVTINPKAEAVLTENKKDKTQIKAWLAQNFSALLSKNQQVSMLPYSKDYAIGNRMTASFADGIAHTLTIPEPDYSVELTLRGMVTASGYQKKQQLIYPTRTFHGLRIADTFDNEDYLEGRFKYNAEAVVPASQTLTDYWTPYLYSILNFYKELSINLGKPSGSWIKKHVVADTIDMKAFKRVKSEILERSR